MGDPRFLLACGAGSRDAGAAWWAGTRAPAAPGSTGPADAATGDGAAATTQGGCWYGWRLTGGNNRELGRSAAVYDSVEDCIEAAARVMTAADQVNAVGGPGAPGRVEFEVGADPVTRMWSWRLRVGGQPLAVSGRQYRRNRECLYNLDRFLAAAPVALVCPEPVPVRHAGAGCAREPVGQPAARA